ncbi:MAG: histidine phosphotransferase family protein [Rhodobacterales bacterium]|nr:histidine phosphotransferase family protein [Puniceibacterium antarcticum]
MKQDSANLAALVGARICHDLISPVGAINNGLELLAMNDTAASAGPEIELIGDSCNNAQARIRFFRVAFGTSSDSQQLGRSEVVSILTSLEKGSRLLADWRPTEALSRRDVQLAFLGLLCFETALPQRGTVVFERRGAHWHITGRGPRILYDPDLWQMLTDPIFEVELTSARVQFRMLQLIAQDTGHAPRVRYEEDVLTLDL